MEPNSKTFNDEVLSVGVHRITCPDVTLAYTVKGTGPLLVIQAAGWGISSRYLQIGLAPLEQQFTLLFLEPRGSGISTRPENPADMGSSNMADDIERLRLHLRLNKINLFGHSNGGTIALDYAERYPDHVLKLILVTHRLSDYDDTAEMKRLFDERRHNPIYSKAANTIFKPTPDGQDEWYKYLLEMFPIYFVDPRRHFQAFADSMGVPSRWVNKAQKSADEKKPLPLFENLSKVKAKTLCIGCDGDPVCTANASRVTHEGITESELVVIKDCGHFPWIEMPEQFFIEVIRFMGR